MPWKLVSFITVMVLITFFIGFNLENSCDISFIFYSFKKVPIFVSLLFAYVVGAVTVLPFFFGYRKNRQSKGLKNPKTGIPAQKGRGIRQGRDPKVSRDLHDYDIN